MLPAAADRKIVTALSFGRTWLTRATFLTSLWMNPSVLVCEESPHEPFVVDRGYAISAMEFGLNRRDEVWALVHEHLTAAMIMVRLADPLEDMTAREALERLDADDFDLGLVDDREVRVVYRSELRKLGPKKLDLKVKAVAQFPRFDRLIERSLELGEVAQRLDTDETPLLVVGHDGPDHIITTSDFTRPAGSMALLSATAALDAYLWTALSDVDEHEIELLLDKDEKKIWTRARPVRPKTTSVSILRHIFRSERGIALHKSSTSPGDSGSISGCSGRPGVDRKSGIAWRTDAQ